MSTTNWIAPERRMVQKYFDAIASRYDFLNRLLSLSFDEKWRTHARDLILEGSEKTILDLGAGTGKFLRSFLDSRSWKCAVGLDFSPNMLLKAKKTLSSGVGLVNADFEKLPFCRESFDLVISSFTLRSVVSLGEFFEDIREILSPNGKVAFLCLTRPDHWFFKMFFYPYLKLYLPLVGGLLSGNFKAYRFLSESVRTFWEPVDISRMLGEIGFHDIAIYPLTNGLVTLIVGKK